MKFTIETKTLLKELRLLNLIIAKNKKLPILSQVRLDVGETLKLTKTDLDNTLVCESEIIGTSDAGSICVTSRLLGDIVAAVTDETMDFALAGEQLSITAGKASWSINTNPVLAFPKIPTC